ncbi:unnamed protein product [Paramecium primaurelia]|uniref:WD40-repeat-containing domain n=1 Tax=Paramecium primaurelia TaxID=5886 RepID=A0A8S1LN20_PARPR|nr:unnamed protein product [Paramecium primaurelia]
MSYIDLDACLNQLKCEYGQQHQNSEILLLSLDQGINIKNRLKCKYCLQAHYGKFESMAIFQVLQAIKDKFMSIENHRLERINEEKQGLIKIKDDITNLKSNLNQILDEFSNLIDQLNVEYDNILGNIQFNLMNEIQEIAEQQYSSINLTLDQFNNKLISIKMSYKEKFQKKLLNIQEQISSIVEKYSQNDSRNKENEIQLIQNNIQRISNIKIKIINNAESNQIIKYQNISEIQCQYCLALAFDYQCKQLAVCSKEYQVEIYNIENGIIQNKQSILQHQNKIYSIIYSKNQNWLVTGTGDGNIYIWKLQDSQWQKFTSQYQHQSTVFCLLLNKKEDILFSSSEDQTIIIWNLDIDQNKLEIRQQINTESGNIYSISLNEQENYLACCSRKSNIMIWENQGQNTQWVLKQIIQLDENLFGFRLGFYGDFLIFQPKNRGICIIYKEESLQFQEFQQLQLNNKESNDEVGLSPIKYSKMKDVMILKHNISIYFIRKQSDQKFQIFGEQINCQNNIHFSTIALNGEYLAQWTNDQKITIYKLDLE